MSGLSKGTCFLCKRGAKTKASCICRPCEYRLRSSGKYLCQHPRHEGPRTLPVSNFSSDGATRSGKSLRPQCKECEKARRIDYEAARARQRQTAISPKDFNQRVEQGEAAELAYADFRHSLVMFLLGKGPMPT